jgi:hypothetical protein
MSEAVGMLKIHNSIYSWIFVLANFCLFVYNTGPLWQQPFADYYDYCRSALQTEC